jgi:iron complex transport system substrate-binding protein
MMMVRLVTAAACLLAALPAGRNSTAAAPVPAPTDGEAGVTWLGSRPTRTPRRLVSLAPSATDMIVALGHADRLAGVSRYDNAPEVAGLPRIGGFLDPVPEAVLSLKPDLALWVSDGGGLAAVQQLADLGIPVLVLPLVSLSDVMVAVRAVARALDDPPAGERLVASLESSISRTRAAAAHLAKVRVLLAVGREPLIVAGPGSYADELIRIVGGVNVVQGQRPWPVYPLERAVADDPEVFLDAAVNEHRNALGPLSAIPAVKRGGFQLLASDDVLRPGPRLTRALSQLFRAIHPGAEPP